MASESRTKAGLVLAAGALTALGVLAGFAAQSPRLQVLCVLAGLVPAGLLAQALGRLTLRVPQPESVADLALPGQQALLENCLLFEARLEHAPIALFCIDSGGAVSPLNTNARKLVAPGRASDPGALYQLLQQQAVDARSMIAFDSERGVERALVSVSAMNIQGKPQRLLALMPVESELEAEALNAWRQLVHVLTHEIMNSLTPVASLSRTALELMDEQPPPLPAATSADIRIALDAISRRAGSLVDFVASYRSLSNLPPAQPELVDLSALFARVAALVAPAWQTRGGEAAFSCAPATLELMVDPGQLEQALINLVKNAAEATANAGAPRVQVSARLARGGRLRIEVSDNGRGVPEALIAHIFTPFFSTKKQGGGIGLAMVRQLVHGNGGTVRYAKTLGAGAQFVITF